MSKKDDPCVETLPICPCQEPPADRNYAQYYDSPDGCDIPTKIKVATRYGIVAGLIMGSYDILMFSHAVGLNNMLRRYAKYAVPLGAMGATFALVANSAVAIRQADDELNYVLGGIACSPIAVMAFGTWHALVPSAVILGIVGMVKKTAIIHGHKFFADVTPHRCMINSWRNDYTLVRDPLCDEK